MTASPPLAHLYIPYIPYQHALSVHPLNTPYHHTNTHPTNTLLLTHHNNTPYQHTSSCKAADQLFKRARDRVFEVKKIDIEALLLAGAGVEVGSGVGGLGDGAAAMGGTAAGSSNGAGAGGGGGKGGGSKGGSSSNGGKSGKGSGGSSSGSSSSGGSSGGARLSEAERWRQQTRAQQVYT